MDEYGMAATVLMERAGLAVFDAIAGMMPGKGSIGVLCGKGNNGGDGFVVARVAAQRGYRVEVIVASREDELREEAYQQMLQARAQGINPIYHGDERWQHKLRCLACKDLLVDALLGTGTEGLVRGPILECIQAINRSGVRVVSVDVPSGIHTDTGEELNDSVWATRTVTFGHPKPFLFQGLGLERAGQWVVADIGYPPKLLRECTGVLFLECRWCAAVLPERMRSAHKYSIGHVLVVAGSRTMRGAAVLAAMGAMRAGAGMVTVASVPEVLDAVAAQVPEALLMPLPSANGVVDPSAAELLTAKQDRWHSALFGPGLTQEEPAREMLRSTWAHWTKPCCIDADALGAVAAGVPLPAGPVALTPHPGEMSRLMQSSVAEVQSSRMEVVRSAVDRYGRAVLLKGPFSVLAAPMEPVLVNSTGNPGMASAGMGDVLGGMAAALLAQDLSPYHALGAAMYWHGLAGDMCAQEWGDVGFTASDVAHALPRARAKLAVSCCVE